MKQALIGLVMCLVWESAVVVHEQPPRQRSGSDSVPRVYRLEELTWTQIDALDRQRTLVILPIGMLEQHGPPLPVGSDTIGATHEAEAASRRVSRALPDWRIVLMPAVHYGNLGANEIGNMPVHPGTYSIRQSTLRSLVADVGTQLAQNGF